MAPRQESRLVDGPSVRVPIPRRFEIGVDAHLVSAAERGARVVGGRAGNPMSMDDERHRTVAAAHQWSRYGYSPPGDSEHPAVTYHDVSQPRRIGRIRQQLIDLANPVTVAIEDIDPAPIAQGGI